MYHPPRFSLRLRLVAAALAFMSLDASAALAVGAAAPTFTTEAATAGEASRFDLAENLKNGPVVLYFYPKAFTSGCTVEAHQFAEASDKFKALGARVVGISNDDIATLKKFSVEACRNKFSVAADAGAKIIRSYDAKLAMVEMADRISYLITPDGKIAAVHASMNADGHVDAMLKAVERWKAGKK
ncbi:peroxiredoxin [Paucibacter sp. APW11]|uniref:thioredoxin-dependent peroxiredoxin n=1 Tax=Roseateles aquae TaxID=3077235 RepID=A0ABU3PI95_9BURK|nr:peroxiredoxin [Paucibacter sp. APW11]MDT9001837.1 peroxiredoxin [Paucibacter sp. APW11]